MINVSALGFLHPGALTGFSDVSFVVPSGGHAALVGDNGVGKSTLLRILAGELTPDDGEATVTGQVRFMPQEVGLDRPDDTLRELLGSFAPAPLDAVSARRGEAERALAGGDDLAGMALGEALADWGDLGGYELEATWDVACREVMGVGFDEVAERTASSLSGGERKRLVLATLFASGVDVLLLDEPDNYLDVPAKVELARQLRASTQTILLVSHDRDLLAEAPDRIVTLESRGAWVHHGTWRDYEQARADRQERLGDELQRWQDEERRLRDLVRILKERARYSDVFAAKAKAAESRWRRFADAGPPPPPSTDQEVTIRLAGAGSGKRMLRLVGLGVADLVQPFSDEVHHGDRIGLVGPNGTGKTHLVRALAGVGTHQGEVVHGARVTPGYFAQVTFNAALAGREPLDVVSGHVGSEQRARAALARYGLAGNARQPYETLSGGQKARLEVLLLELAGVNLLLLDEPTDNLDIASAQALEAALEGFDGAVVAVSHDRAFLRTLGRHLHVGDDGVVHELADWDATHRALVEGVGVLPRSAARRLTDAA